MENDILIIGAGPGGYETAVEAAAKGLTVTIVEAAAPGGTCLNEGCIPTKALCRSAEVADLMKRAMINVDQALPEGAQLILQIHDSLIIECDDNQVDKISTILREKMEQVEPNLPIKLAVDVTVGKNWGEL